jgi:hypothetical protein
MAGRETISRDLTRLLGSRGSRRRPDRDARITILVRDGVFVTSARGGCGESAPVGPLSDFVKSMPARPRSAGALLGGVLGEAQSYAQRLSELEFCVHELIPLLRSFQQLAQGGARRSVDVPRISTPTYRKLEARARELLGCLDSSLPALESDVLASALGTPCAIVSGSAIPLERVASGTPPGLFVTVLGERYALRAEGKRPLRDLLQGVRRQEQRRAEQNLAAQPDLSGMAADFLGDVKSILARYRPLDCGRYQLFHRDDHHQLQHSRGRWMLVRGPVTSRSRSSRSSSRSSSRTGRESFFVGLPIIGATRAKRLSVPPRPSPSLECLWTPRGEPAQGGLCVGVFSQYRHLLSSELFSDAEALLNWGDAGVILATGRSNFHREWRELTADRRGSLAQLRELRERAERAAP